MNRLVFSSAAVVAYLWTGLLFAGTEEKEALPAGAAARLGNARFLNVGRVFSVAYAPDGRLLAAGAWDGSLRLWDPLTGKLEHVLDGHKKPVEAVTFSADGKWLVSASADKGLLLWDTATGRFLRRLGELGSAHHPAFSPDGKYVAAVAQGTLYLWDAATGKELWRQGGDRWNGNFVFRPDSTTLAALASKPLTRFNGRLYPDRNARTYLSEWSLTEKKEIQTIDLKWGGDHSPQAVTLAPGGRTVAFATPWKRGGDFDNEIRFLGVDNGKRAGPIKLRGQYVQLLCISPDRRMLASVNEPWGSNKNRPPYLIRVWELASGQERCRFSAPDDCKLCLAFAPDCRRLASGGLDITVLLWDLTGHARDKKPPTRLAPEELDKLWSELKKDNDAAAAYRAIWKLVQSADQAVPFLARNLRALPAPDPKYVADLVRKLADDNFQVRQKASLELSKLKELAVPALAQALAGKTLTLEGRRRIEHLLEQLDKVSPESLRTLRAVEALELMETPAAVQLLRQLAAGPAAASLTAEARAALARLRGPERN